MNGLWLRSLWLVLAGAVFFASVGLTAVWAPDLPLDELKARWAPPPSTFIEINGQQVHLRDEGPRHDPLPILLVHGTSASLHTWQGWAEGLRGQRRVVRFDLPGFGLTGPNRQDDYSIERYVLFVRSVAARLGIDRFVLAGNSLGGQVAWATAAALPERVDRLILVDAAGYGAGLAGSSGDTPLAFRVARLPVLRTVAQYALPRGLVESSLRRLYGDPGKVTPELVDRYSDMARREGNRAALAHQMAQAAGGPDPAVLATIRVPTLVLWGGRDRLLPPALGERFARDIPGARLVVLEDLGHMPQEEDPGRTLAEVRRFLGS